MGAARPKAFMKQNKLRKKKDQPLESADDYLAAGVDDEDAMGKHRGGDGPKSMRFAHKALTTYREGLARYPKNFDLAYNRARLELEMITHPVLVLQLEMPMLAALEVTLASHEYALALDDENADLLFNAAQVKTTMAEEIAKDDSKSNDMAIQFLQQAIDDLNKCLTIQQHSLRESVSQHEQALALTEEQFSDEAPTGGVKLDSNDLPASEDEQWVAIVEPVTQDTILDTLVAQVNTLTTFFSIVNSDASPLHGQDPETMGILAKVEGFANNLLEERLAGLEPSDRSAEVALARANLLASMLETGFRLGRLDGEQYRSQLGHIFADDFLSPEDFDVYVSNARALIAMNSAIHDRQAFATERVTEASESLDIRWSALSAVVNLLAKASKLPNLAQDQTALTHLLRGDASLLLQSLSRPPYRYRQALANGQQLLKNAEVFYRNAGKLFGAADAKEEQAIAQIRGAVAVYLQDAKGSSIVEAVSVASRDVLRSHDDLWLSGQLEDMANEGLIEDHSPR